MFAFLFEVAKGLLIAVLAQLIADAMKGE